MKTAVLFVCLCIASAAFPLHAQSTFGAIVGTVKDTSGAVINRAHVTITDTDENVSREVTTDATGNYEALNLQPARYQVAVSATGFEQEVVKDLQLAARQTSRVDVTMQVGAATQSVDVEGQAGVIASETDTIASSYGSEQILELPANLRASTDTSPYFLLTTLPGVQQDSGNDNYLSIQGGLPNQSESSIDGISSQNVRSNRPLFDIFPSTENIAEMKVSGVGNTAEFGSAGDITTITKSGTNTYHGSLVWYFQNADLDATPFGSSSKPEKNVNDFAFSAGGPVIIPKIYNGKNKTFFFADYEQLIYPRTSTVQNEVPTVAEKMGNFSAEGVTVIDPTTGKPFPNDTIPANRISPIATKILSTFFPDPNTGDLATSHTANWVVNKASDIQSKQYDIRGDQYFGSNQSVFARFSWKNATDLGPTDLLQPTINGTQQDRSLVGSYNYAIRPNLLNEFRVGFTTDSPGSDFAYDGKAFEASLGFVGLPSTPFNGLPDINFNNYTGLDVGRVEDIEIYRTFQINNNTTWTHGRHTIKFGLDIRWLRSKTGLGFIGADNFGNSSFTGAFTGSDFADFLLGLPAQTSYGNVQHDNDGRNQRYQAYIQDSYRVSQKLTLDFGVRWDYNPPFVDQFGNTGNFDPSVPLTGKVIYPSNGANLLAPELLIATNACPGTPNLPAPGPGIPGVPCTPYVTAQADGLGNGLRKVYKFNFAPRFGFAYRPFNNGNTVVRGGFGIYEAPVLGATFYSLTGTAQTDVREFNNISPTGAPIFQWPNVTTGGSGIISTDGYGTSYFGTANSINYKNPYMEQWNFSIDRNLGFSTGLRVSYIGSHSVQLGFAQNLNQSAYSTQYYADQPLTDRPFPYWDRIENRDSGATASYNSLQVELTHHLKNGLTFTGAYTLAKNLSDTGSDPTSFGGETGNGRIMDAYNRDANWGNVYGTRRNRFVGTSLWELPVGKGRTYLNNTNAFVNGILGGWHLSTILVAQSGDYETPYFDGGDPSGTGSGFYRDQRPDRLGTGVPTTQDRSDWIAQGAFVCPGGSCNIGTNPATTPPPIGRFGNSGVGIIEGPGMIALSMGLGKAFTIYERLLVKVEGSFTNLPNVTNLADPTLAVTNKNFGQITSSVGNGNGGFEFSTARTGQVGVRIEF